MEVRKTELSDILFSKANLLLLNQRLGIPTKKDLIKKNMISLTWEDLFDETDIDEYLSHYIRPSTPKDNYMTLPCFKEGVYKVKGADNGEGCMYYYYKFIESEVNENLEHYKYEINCYNSQTDKTFILMCHMILDIIVDTDLRTVDARYIEGKHGYDLYRKNDIEKSDLAQIINLPSKQKSALQACFIDDLRESEELMWKRKEEWYEVSNGEHQHFKEMGSFFFILNIFTNETLEKNKLHTKRSSGSTTKVTYEPSGKPQPKVLYRTAGAIKFHSSEIPRCATEEVVRHYTCMSWQQRGHVRRYKSGKEVWIKPCVKRRQKSNNEPPIVKLNIV